MKITGMTVRVVGKTQATTIKQDGRLGGELRMEYPLITLHTDEGIDGWTMGYGIHGDGPSQARLFADVFFPYVKGKDVREHEGIWQQLFRRQRHLYNLADTWIGILDVALWDIRGKAADLPIADLLGRCRDRVPCYATALSKDYSPQEFQDEASRVKAAGYHGYKIQVHRGPAWDLPRLRAAREAVGPGFSLMHDPNSGYDFLEALTVGRELDKLGYSWFEEPIPDRQIDGLKELARRLDLPVIPTETSALSEMQNYLTEPQFPILRGDVLLKAGITGLRKAMNAAELLGKRLEIHAANSPLLDVANLHVACACSNSTYIEMHHPIFRFGLKHSPLELGEGGCQLLPQAPGLGVELDWDWVENTTQDKFSVP